MATTQHPEVYIAVQSGVSTLILGEPGITKTKGFEAFAKFLGRKFKSIVPSQMDPADIIGYPSIAEVEINGAKQTVTRFVPRDWRVELETCKEGGFLLLDELLDCSPSHQAAIQQLLNDGVSNSLLAACGNPVEISTNGYQLSAAVINRLCVLDYTAPVDEWKRNMMTDFAPVPDQFPVLPSDWKKHLPEARGLVCGFLEKIPTEAQACPADRSNQAKPWPSLRSWTNAATMLSAAKACNSSIGAERKLVSGCVGEGASTKFYNWRKALDLPDIVDVLAKPKMFKFGDRLDRTYVVVSSAIAYLTANQEEAVFEKVCNLLVVAAEEAMALSVMGAKALSDLRREHNDWKYPEIYRNVFTPILVEAGRTR